MTMSTRLGFWATLLTVMLCTPLLWADGKSKGSDPERRAKIEQRMNQIRARVLRERVGLDDAKAKQVERIMDKYEPERRKHHRQMREHMKQLSTLVDADSNDQKAYERALEGIRAGDKQAQELREKELGELAKVLTPKQRAKLTVSIRQMKRAVDRRMHRKGAD